MNVERDDSEVSLSPDQVLLFRAFTAVTELEREAVPFGEQWRDVCLSLRALLGCLWDKIEETSNGTRACPCRDDDQPPAAL